MTRECHVRICERLGMKFRARLGKMRTRREGSCWRKAGTRPTILTDANRAGTDQYSKGKYIGEGVWDPTPSTGSSAAPGCSAR